MSKSNDENKRFLDFIEYYERETKPRSVGWTMCTFGGNVPSGLFEYFSEYVDLLKLTGGSYWMTTEQILDVIERCHENDIEVQTGGVPYELARLQGKEETYFDALEELDVDWVEYETHVNESTQAEMERSISDLKDRGFDVIGEVGAKWYWRDHTRTSRDKIKIDTTVEAMNRYLNAGCDYVYWEGSIVQNLIGRDLMNREGQKALREVTDRVGQDNIVFEFYGTNFPSREYGRFWAWLVNQFGPSVNLANVPAGLLPRLESIRRGILYEMDHPYIRWYDEGKPTADWWRIESPPLDVGINAPR